IDINTFVLEIPVRVTEGALGSVLTGNLVAQRRQGFFQGGIIGPGEMFRTAPGASQLIFQPRALVRILPVLFQELVAAGTVAVVLVLERIRAVVILVIG